MIKVFLTSFFVLLNSVQAQESARLSERIGSCFAGLITSQLQAATGGGIPQHEFIGRFDTLINQYSNRTNECRQKLQDFKQQASNIEGDSELRNKVLDEEIFQLVAEINDRLGPGLDNGVWPLRRMTAGRIDYNQFSCDDIINQDSVLNQVRDNRLLCIDTTKNKKRELCQNYDQMISCFKDVENYLIDNDLAFSASLDAISNDPRYGELDNFDFRFIDQTFPPRANINQ